MFFNPPLKIVGLYVFLIGLSCQGWGQETLNRWHIQAGVGAYSATLGVPDLTPFHPGLKVGARYQWNVNPTHQFIQQTFMAWYNHRLVQHGLQFYSEIGYRFKVGERLWISPIHLGCGYVLSISQLNSLKWNPDTEEYEVIPGPFRSNWMISLGSSVAYQSDLTLWEAPLTFFLDYRVQVQAIFITGTAPLNTYTPIIIGISWPLNRN